VSVERRRFSPPWDIEDNGSCFIIRDANGQPLSYVYYENEPGRRTAAGLLTRDEARRIAINIARLPELLKGPIAFEPRRAGTTLRRYVEYGRHHGSVISSSWGGWREHFECLAAVSGASTDTAAMVLEPSYLRTAAKFTSVHIQTENQPQRLTL
jgi:hypothetical protein